MTRGGYRGARERGAMKRPGSTVACRRDYLKSFPSGCALQSRGVLGHLRITPRDLIPPQVRRAGVALAVATPRSGSAPFPRSATLLPRYAPRRAFGLGTLFA